MDEQQDAFDRVMGKAFGFRSLEEYKAFEERYGRHVELMESLRFDWYFASWQLEPDDDETEQLDRRTLIRTLLAWIEGAVFALKREVLELHRLDRVDLCTAEYALLCEESYSLKESGVVDISASYLRLLPNVKFTLRIYARAWDASFDFDPPLEREPRWQSLCRAHGVRNRLMHPKSLEDLAVSDSELKDALEGADWFEEQLNRAEGIAMKGIARLVRASQAGTQGAG